MYPRFASFRFRPVYVLPIAYLILPVSFAETTTYTAHIGQESRVARVNDVAVDGLPSVSLKGLIGSFGGQFKVSGNSVQLTFMNGGATLTLGDTEVVAAQRFTLQHAPRVYENDIYIDVNDVIPLFKYAFNIIVTTGETVPPEPGQPVAPALPSDRRLRVVLDAGHGGTDAGATGQGSTSEKDITRAIAHQVAKLIEGSCQAAFTRVEDTNVTASERVSMTNVALKGDLLVSIHVGASESSSASGFEFFCPMGSGDSISSRSLALARSMSNAMAETTAAPPRGVHQAPCRIFNGLQVPGVLVEIGFITNPKEEPLLIDAGYQGKLAQGIANGILAYASGKAQ